MVYKMANQLQGTRCYLASRARTTLRLAKDRPSPVLRKNITYVEEVWTDMQPLNLCQKMEEGATDRLGAETSIKENS